MYDTNFVFKYYHAINNLYESLTRKFFSYIADLDSLYTLALATTVSPRQAIFLRNFISKHLAFRALIGVELPVR